MHALVLRCVNHYRKFEVPSFTNYKYNWGKIKKTVHMTLTTALLGVVCHRRLGFDTVYMYINTIRYDTIRYDTVYLHALKS